MPNDNSKSDNAKSWLGTLKILAENAVNTIPADADLSAEDIAKAIAEGAANTGRVSTKDFNGGDR